MSNNGLTPENISNIITGVFTLLGVLLGTILSYIFILFGRVSLKITILKIDSHDLVKGNSIKIPIQKINDNSIVILSVTLDIINRKNKNLIIEDFGIIDSKNIKQYFIDSNSGLSRPFDDLASRIKNISVDPLKTYSLHLKARINGTYLFDKGSNPSIKISYKRGLFAIRKKVKYSFEELYPHAKLDKKIE